MKNKLTLPIKMHRTPTLEPNVPRSLMGTYTPADRDQSQGWEKHSCLEQQSAGLRNSLPSDNIWLAKMGRHCNSNSSPPGSKGENSLTLFCIYSSVCVFCACRGQRTTSTRLIWQPPLSSRHHWSQDFLTSFFRILKPKPQTILSLNTEATSDIKHTKDLIPIPMYFLRTMLLYPIMRQNFSGTHI